MLYFCNGPQAHYITLDTMGRRPIVVANKTELRSVFIFIYRSMGPWARRARALLL